MAQWFSSVRSYFIVFAALLVLVALTVEAARYDMGNWNFVVAVLIASTKGLLIAMVFMEVRGSRSLTKLVIASGLLWLAILFSLTLADYWTR